MTIEQLLDLPPDGLEALTDEQLIAHLSPYFPITRPQRILTPTVSATAKTKAVTKTIMDRVLTDPTMTPEKIRALRELIK